jgi:hypothetical protein
MNNQRSDVGRALANALHLSSQETHEREKVAETGRAQYRRKYWQGYAKRVKRIFGTVTRAEYDAAKERSEAAGRSVWAQVWAEATAYREQTLVPTSEIADQQRELIAELRRIGNNINQLAKLGHVQARKHGGLGAQPSNPIGTEAMRQFEKLEAKVAWFDDGITIRVRAEQVNDH